MKVKKFVPRLVAWCMLLLLGAVAVITSFSVPLLIVVAVLLALVAFAVFVGKKHSMVRDAPWFIAGGFVLAVLIPSFLSTPEAMVAALEQLLRGVDAMQVNSMLSFGFLAVLGTQLFLRKSDKLIPIMLRYAAMSLFLLGVGEGLIQEMFNLPAITIILLCLAYELRTRAHGEHQRRTLCCIVCTFGCYAVSLALGMTGKLVINSVFGLYNKWLYVIIGAAILGGLMILEEYYHQKLRGEAPSAHADLGGVLLLWSLLCLIMKLWDQTMNWYVLVPGMIAAYHCYGMFMGKWRKRGGSELKTFLIVWSLITLGALVLGKSLNVFAPVAVIILVLLVAAAVCWSVSTRKRTEWLIMTSYLGVAAVVLLSTVVCPDLNDVMGMAKAILCAALLSVGWCVLCSTIAKLDQQASEIYTGEFKMVRKVACFVPTVAIAVAVVMVLFA